MMHQRIPNIFKVSAIALAVLYSTGCAVTANPSSIGDSLSNAGRTTANASSRVFEGTKRLFGFDRTEAKEPELDEVDLALMEDEALPLAETDVVVTQPVLTADAPVMKSLEQPATGAPPVDAPAIATMPATDPSAVAVATVDYTHVVGPNETMWTIAKLTTGNPNNWRILAEINKMDLNSPIHIGQEVFVPADLVSPEIVSSLPVIKTLPLPAELAAEAADDGLTTETSVVVADLTADPLKPKTEGDTADNAELKVAAAKPAASEKPKAGKDMSLNALPLTADAGETLWDMAKRTTGDATNWKAIAKHNNFTERDIATIRYGQTIYVPDELAKVELGGKNKVVAKAKPKADTDGAATDALVSAKTEKPAKAIKTADATKATEKVESGEAVEASAALVASASNILDETQDIKIVEATFQATKENGELPTVKPENGAGVDFIMVSGTYYPKAVYIEADFSSSLLMRVSPGTQLTVSRTIGPWYEVQTEHGLGFMHSRDVK